MTEAAFFEALDRPGHYLGTEHTFGPWDRRFMHAGPPTALVAHVAAGAPGLPTQARLGRITAELLGPVPVGPVEVRRETVRPGERIALVSAELSAGGRTVMLARLWFLRTATGVPVPATGVEPAPTDPGRPAPEGTVPFTGGYMDAMEWRWVSGGFAKPGGSTVWAGPRLPLVAGSPITPTEALLTLADSANGISAVADPRELLFVNTELSVHLHREPGGDRFWLRAQTQLNSNGSGLASGVIGDAGGDLGRTEQLLFVEPRG